MTVCTGNDYMGFQTPLAPARHQSTVDPLALALRAASFAAARSSSIRLSAVPEQLLQHTHAFLIVNVRSVGASRTTCGPHRRHRRRQRQLRAGLSWHNPVEPQDLPTNPHTLWVCPSPSPRPGATTTPEQTRKHMHALRPTGCYSSSSMTLGDCRGVFCPCREPRPGAGSSNT